MVERAKSWLLYPALDARCVVLDEALLLALLGYIAKVSVVHSKEYNPKNCKGYQTYKKSDGESIVGHFFVLLGRCWGIGASALAIE